MYEERAWVARAVGPCQLEIRAGVWNKFILEELFLNRNKVGRRVCSIDIWNLQRLKMPTLKPTFKSSNLRTFKPSLQLSFEPSTASTASTSQTFKSSHPESLTPWNPQILEPSFSRTCTTRSLGTFELAKLEFSNLYFVFKPLKLV